MVVALIAIGFAAVLFAGLAAGLAMYRGQQQTVWVNHTYEVERYVGAIRLALEEMRSARRGLMLKIVSSSGASYDEARSRLFHGVDEVARLTIDNPRQQRNIGDLRRNARALDTMFVTSMRTGTARSPVTETARENAARTVETLAGRMLAEERRLLKLRDQAQRNSVETFYAVLAGAALLLLLVAIGSVLLIRRYTHDLTKSREALRDLNENLEGAVRERTTDLQRANEEIQRFAYIVSHDLRSPLVNVMGFTAELDTAITPLAALIDKAEVEAPGLVSIDARNAVREDLPEAVGFIRTSTQKMDRLINAILRLSREGRRPITPEPVDIGDIVQGAVDAIRHRIDEQGVTVEIAPDLPTIVTDRFAIDQILSNIIENAVKYLQPGRPGLIQINGHIVTDRAMIRVKDNGRGVDARDHERIFDLFRRSGVQDQPGEGIGLAHVRALAYRLGGKISVASALDAGATFTINLPAIFAGEQGA